MAKGTSISARMRKHAVTRYMVVLVLTAVALLVGRTLGPLLGDYVAYAAIFVAIASSAWYCGLGPSALATLLALAGLRYWFISPVHHFGIVSSRQALGMVAFLTASAAIIALGETRRRENAALRQAQGELEDQVNQRTTELATANQGLRELSTRLMQMQDDERRRIARELHDSVGQTLAALSMNLTTVGNDVERLAQTAKTIADSAALVQEMNKEVRTMSHLLHPPLLDEAGLLSAVKWYIDGFARRSKIEVDLEVEENFGRLPQELETAIFRTVQECLTNIHRHSGSPTARIRLVRCDGEVLLLVRDNGIGVATDQLNPAGTAATPGVGIRGMRERLRQLGGTLQVSSPGRGTVVEARVPIATPSTLVSEVPAQSKTDGAQAGVAEEPLPPELTAKLQLQASRLTPPIS